jgi:tRNA/tmRNA/rRNA uracil-C5-methylase (TrmA/RlmC/RlmD family)
MNKPGKTANTFRIRIEKIVYGGEGLGRREGKVVFVPFSVPGDRLLVRPVEEKKTFLRAEIVRILESGPGRIEPPCPHFGQCGGCQLQQLDYPRQVEAKRQILEEIFFHRFPHTRGLAIVMRASSQPFGYRSRARVQLRGCGARATVGFFRCGSHAVEDIEECPLFRPSLNEALRSLRQYKLKVDADPKPQEMDMACSEEEDTWATTRVGGGDREGLALFPGSGMKEDVILRRRVGEFVYRVTASVFFQVNDFIAPELAALVGNLAKDAGRDSALDLFAGAGFFSLPLARLFKKVIAVDNSTSACRLCTANASAAALSNVQAVCADVSAWTQSAGSSDMPGFDLVVLDPPRAGAGAGIMERIQKWAPNTILYVSCDPQTLSRDIARLSARDYEIDHIEGLDMFPQTYHFETVVRLTRR